MSIGFDIDIKFNCFSIILFGVVYVNVGGVVSGGVGVDSWYGLWLRSEVAPVF